MILALLAGVAIGVLGFVLYSAVRIWSMEWFS